MLRYLFGLFWLTPPLWGQSPSLQPSNELNPLPLGFFFFFLFFFSLTHLPPSGILKILVPSCAQGPIAHACLHTCINIMHLCATLNHWTLTLYTFDCIVSEHKQWTYSPCIYIYYKRGPLDERSFILLTTTCDIFGHKWRSRLQLEIKPHILWSLELV